MRFTTRDLLWLTALVAMALAWGADHAWCAMRTWRYDFWKGTALEFAECLKDEGYRVSLDEELGVRGYGKMRPKSD